jgi:hypothetical protein
MILCLSVSLCLCFNFLYSDTARWRQDIKEEVELAYSQKYPVTTPDCEAELSREIQRRCYWICRSHCYHKCVGLISASGHLSIWDFGEVYTCNRSTGDYQGAVQALCVTPYSATPPSSAPTSAPSSSSCLQSVIWGDEVVIPLHVWVDILLPPDAAHCPPPAVAAAPSSEMKSMKTQAQTQAQTQTQTQTQETETNQNRDAPRSQASANHSSDANSLSENKQRAVISGIFSSPSESRLGCKLSPDPVMSTPALGSILQQVTLNSNYFGATTSPSGGKMSRDGVVHPTPPVVSAPVSVFISGCHMSPNPGPGVGLARALRAHYSSRQLRLVAVDDMLGDSYQGLTDHIFDEVMPAKIGKVGEKKKKEEKEERGRERRRGRGSGGGDEGMCTDTPASASQLLSHTPPSPSSKEDVELDDVCWDALVNWLAPSSTRSSEQAELDAPLAFFLPCSDEDVRLLSCKMSTVLLAQTADFLSTSDDNNRSADGGDGDGDGDRDGDGDGVIRRDSGHASRSSRDIIACSRILCPSEEAVISCRKPQIAAISHMDCFVVPDYFVLTDEVCLSEVQAFCEVDYPVMFKVGNGGS